MEDVTITKRLIHFIFFLMTSPYVDWFRCMTETYLIRMSLLTLAPIKIFFLDLDGIVIAYVITASATLLASGKPVKGQRQPLRGRQSRENP